VTLRPFFRAAARLEYDEAAGWYEQQRSGLGIEFVAEIEHALQQACEAPYRFPRMLADVRCVRVRRFPYSIFFRPRADRIVVLCVFHARRDPLIWRERS
jgi:plasmid stabilization system protein ParE